MTKTSEMSREAFGIAVAERTADLRNKALAAGVPKEQLEEIITSVYGQTQDLSLKTAVNRIANAFVTKIEAATATLLVGVLVGSRDFAGSKQPIRYMLVKPDKKHVEIHNFGTTAQYQGEKIEIPVPAKVELRAMYDAEYDSWNLKEIVSYQLIDKTTLIDKVLSKVVIPVKDITKDMAREKGKSGKCVVLTGRMDYFNTEVIFKPREDFNDGKKAEVDRYLPVLMPRELGANSPERLPCFQFSLLGKGHGANAPRCHFQQMRHGTPNAMVEDLMPILTRAVNKFPNSPEDQTGVLTEYLKDMNVFVVGAVNKFTTTSSEDKSDRNYIDIAVSCLVDIETPFEGFGGQKQITPPPAKSTPHITTDSPPVGGKIESTKPATPEAASAPAATEEAESEEDKEARLAMEAAQAAAEKAKAAKAAKAAAAAAKTATAPAQPAADAGSPETKLLEAVRAIKLYCRAAGVKPTDVSLDILKTKALDMFDDIPDAVVMEALDFLKASKAATGQ